MRNKIVLLAAIAASLAGCSKAGAPSKDVAARVNGKNILRSEVDKYFNFKSMDQPQKPSGEAARIAKLDIVRDLIEREIMGQKAEQLKLSAKDEEINSQIKELQGTGSDADFKAELAKRGFTVEDMRNEIRRTIVVQSLVRSEVASKIKVGDEEIAGFYNENRAAFDIKEPQYRIGQIVVSANPSIPVNNAKNDKALNPDQAAIKVQRLMNLIKGGGDFMQIARDFSEDPQTTKQGGDLGYHTASTLDQLGPQLKQAILKMNSGDVAPVIKTQDNFWILKLLDKREPGLRTLADADVKAGIQNELMSQKQQLYSTAFSEKLHNEARVENFLAEEVLAGAK